jgi:hypothetical protein
MRMHVCDIYIYIYIYIYNCGLWVWWRVREEACKCFKCCVNYIVGRVYILRYTDTRTHMHVLMYMHTWIHTYFVWNGRLGSEFVVDLLFTIVKEERNDSRVRQQALGCLQKCSLRRSVQGYAIHMGVCVYVYIHVHVCVYVCVCVGVYKYIYIYIYIYIYVCIYIYIYIYIHIYRNMYAYVKCYTTLK